MLPALTRAQKKPSTPTTRIGADLFRCVIRHSERSEESRRSMRREPSHSLQMTRNPIRAIRDWFFLVKFPVDSTARLRDIARLAHGARFFAEAP
jgi:hypothetical protein